MSEGLKALENILKQELIKPNKYRKTIGDIASAGQIITIQKELKALETIKKHFKFRCLGISPHRDPSLDTCYVVTENIKEVPIEKWKLLKEVLEDE